MEPEMMKQFSREELEAMGEVDLEPGNPEPEPEPSPEPGTKPALEHEPEPKPPEGKEGEPEPEPEPEEGKPESWEQDKPVPYKRFSKWYGQEKQRNRELQEKLDLFKSDQEAYYEKYPDEKPAGKADRVDASINVPPPTKIMSFREMLTAKVNDPDSPDFHGKTLEELMAEGPLGIAAAQDYYTEYVESVRDEVTKAKAAEESSLNALKEEDNRFADARAQELFQKPINGIDASQHAKVEKIIQDTLAWMKANKRMAYKLEDSYRLMKYDEAIRAAEAKGAKGLVDLAKSGNVLSVGSGGGGKVSADPYAKYMGMSETDLSALIMKMPDAEYDKFLKDASPDFRKKFKDLPYPY